MRKSNCFLVILTAVVLVSCQTVDSSLPPVPVLSPKHTIISTVSQTSIPNKITLTASQTPNPFETTSTALQTPTLAVTETFVSYGCQEPGYPGTIHYANTDDFGDGYIALVSIDAVAGKNYKEIVQILVTQWLEHYKQDYHKTESETISAGINDYEVEEITLFDPSCDPFFTIVASIRFSIIPSEVPHAMMSFPGEIKEGDVWWRHLFMPVGVFIDGNDYRMRLVFGWGT